MFPGTSVDKAVARDVHYEAKDINGMGNSNLKHLSVPEIALIAVTRGAIGFGAGLLLANKFAPQRRKTLGWLLFLSGLASTIPIAMYVFRKES